MQINNKMFYLSYCCFSNNGNQSNEQEYDQQIIQYISRGAGARFRPSGQAFKYLHMAQQLSLNNELLFDQVSQALLKTLSVISHMNMLYFPTCPEYTILAIQKYGVIKGVIKGVERIRRCRSQVIDWEDYPQSSSIN